MADRRLNRRGSCEAPLGLRGLPRALAEPLAAAGAHRIWENGRRLLPRGQVAAFVHILLRGRLRITAAATPEQEVFLRWQQPGDIVGLTSVVSGRPFPVDAVTFDDCETLQVEREDLLALLRADPEAAMAAAELLAHYTYDLIDLVTLRTEQTLTARVLAALHHLAMLNGEAEGPGCFSLAVSQADIAAAVGASRQRVNAELRTLEREGLIELGYRRLRVHGVPAPVTANGFGSDRRYRAEAATAPHGI